MKKARTIKLYRERPFEEELLPQQTLLHVYFNDNQGYFYRWTPAIRGGEVERVFFKMLEVEGKNNPQGAWGEELRKAAEQIPSLKEFQLPVKVTCSALERAKQDEGDPFGYIIFICVLAEQQPVSTRWAPLLHVPSFCIESCTFSMQGFAEAIEGVALKGRWLISREHTCHGIWDAGQELGIGFYVWLVFGCERSAYQIMACEVADAVRSHIRQVLLDFRAIEKGFNEVS